MSQNITWQEFKNTVNLPEFLVANHYAIVRQDGLKWPVFEKDGDTVIINPNHKSYFNKHNDSDKGSIIDFIKNRLHTSFAEEFQIANKNQFEAINAIIRKHLNLSPDSKTYSLEFVKHSLKTSLSKEANAILFKKVLESALSLNDLSPFLNKNGIHQNTLSNDLFLDKFLTLPWKDDLGNAYMNTAFKYTDATENIIGLEVRNFKYKGHAEGSDRSIGVGFSNIPPNGQVSKFFLVESFKDMLSHFQLNQKSLMGENIMYASCGGSLTGGQIETIKSRLISLKKENRLADNFSIISATDNDINGSKYDTLLISKMGEFESHAFTISLDKIKQQLEFSFLNENDAKRVYSNIAPNPDTSSVSYKEFNGMGKIVTMNNKESVDAINKSLLSVFQPIFPIGFHKSRLKDWNDDLKAEHKILPKKKVDFSNLNRSQNNNKI